MKLYFAPLEGITSRFFRQAYEHHIGGVDRYYSPFVTTRDGGIMKRKEMRDILPENNRGIVLIPQLLTNSSSDFLKASMHMKELGYNEVNLNLGCPSGTVVPKGKGAGFLRDLDALKAFLDDIFTKCPLDISIKSRIGFSSVEEFPALLDLYNKYPVKELILHLRTRQEMYKGPVHREVFDYAAKHSKNPLCYNGDICSAQDVESLKEMYPDLKAVMIGRGFLMQPGFVRKGENGELIFPEFCAERVSCFLKELELSYEEEMSGEVPVLFKMKEIWTFLKASVPDGESWFKKIKKADSLAEYKWIEAEVFRNLR